MSATESRRSTGMGWGMVVAGAVLAVIGAAVSSAARGQRETAQVRERFDRAYGYQPTTLSDSATSLGHVGIGVLAVGVLLGLLGLVVVALRRA